MVSTSWKRRRWIVWIDNAKYEWYGSIGLSVDLPNLTSIISQGSNFNSIGSVILESSLNDWILIVNRYSKSS